MFQKVLYLLSRCCSTGGMKHPNAPSEACEMARQAYPSAVSAKVWAFVAPSLTHITVNAKPVRPACARSFLAGALLMRKHVVAWIGYEEGGAWEAVLYHSPGHGGAKAHAADGESDCARRAGAAPRVSGAPGGL
jgi:hypothetical protein